MIDIEKFICSLIEKTSGLNTHVYHCDLLNALKAQGLEYKNGEIIKTQRRIAAEAKEALYTPEDESEDEKIRKALLNHLTKMWGNCQDDVCGIHVEDAIAWLEKQGSQQPTIIWHSVSEEPEEMKELFCEWESDDATWHDVAFYDEESKTFRHAKMPINVTKWVYVDELLERQGEQKQFDYEHATITQKDDERIRKELINVFSNRGKYLIDQSFGDITVSEALAWLKKQGEQKPIISVAYMVSKYASTPEQGNKGFGKPINCMVRAYRQGILDTLKKIKENNVVEEQQNTTEQNTQKFVTGDKSLSDKHQWEDGDIIRLKNDDGVRWQIFKSPESEINEEWFMSQIMENGIAGGYVSSLILDTKYEFLYNPHKEFLKKTLKYLHN